MSSPAEKGAEKRSQRERIAENGQSTLVNLKEGGGTVKGVRQRNHQGEGSRPRKFIKEFVDLKPIHETR